MWLLFFQSETTESNETLKGLSEMTEDNAADLEIVKQYKAAVENLHNEGEDIDSLNKYKLSTIKLLGINSS